MFSLDVSYLGSDFECGPLPDIHDIQTYHVQVQHKKYSAAKLVANSHAEKGCARIEQLAAYCGLWNELDAQIRRFGGVVGPQDLVWEGRGFVVQTQEVAEQSASEGENR